MLRDYVSEKVLNKLGFGKKPTEAWALGCVACEAYVGNCQEGGFPVVVEKLIIPSSRGGRFRRELYFFKIPEPTPHMEIDLAKRVRRSNRVSGRSLARKLRRCLP